MLRFCFSIRHISSLNRVPHRKTKKILRHFEESHAYNLNPQAVKLRSAIENGLLKKQPQSTLDLLACSQIKLLDTEGMLSVLNTWAFHSPDSLSQTVFYQAFIQLVRKGLWKSVCWNHLVQIIHFVGYLNGDQDSKSLMILFLHSVEDSNALQTTHYKDVCIICEATFRTSTGISSPKMLEMISILLKDYTKELTKDSVWLVMMIKTMVFSKWHDIELLEYLASSWSASGLLKKAPLTAQCYAFSLFGHASYKHDDFFKSLIPTVEYNVMNPAQIVRIKDISMYLWTLSTLAYKLNTENLHKKVLPYLTSQVNEYNLTHGLGIIIQCCLSLWMLGLYPKYLLESCLTVKSFEILNGKVKSSRDLSRLSLLLTITEAENRNLSPEEMRLKKALQSIKLLVPSLAKEVEKRPGLENLANAMRKSGMSHVRLHFPVPIYVAGVSGVWQNQTVHVDLLDPSICVISSSSNRHPAGRVLSKVKLLNQTSPCTLHAFISEEDLLLLRRTEQWLPYFEKRK